MQEIEVAMLTREIGLEPRPERRSEESQQDRADPQDGQGHGHDERAFVRLVLWVAWRAEEDEHYLASHVKRRQERAE